MADHLINTTFQTSNFNAVTDELKTELAPAIPDHDGVFQILRMGMYLFSEAWLCVCVCHVTLLALRNTNRVFSICVKVFKFSSGRASNCGTKGTRVGYSFPVEVECGTYLEL